MTTQALTIETTTINERIKDCATILFIFISTIFVVYVLPKPVGHLLVISVSIVFFKSKKDYLWLAYFFILLIDPGNFFFNNDLTAPFRLPLFTLSAGISLSTNDIFMLAAFVKAITSKHKYRYILSRPIIFIFIYSILLLILSLLIYGTSLGTLTFYLRKFLFYSYFISISFLLKNWEEMVKFFYLLFPFVFMVFFFGIYFYMTGDYFVQLFNPGPLRDIFLISMEGVKRWNGIGVELLLICFITSLSLSVLKKNHSNYLILVGLFSYFTILLTATRIWFVVFTLILLMFLYKSKRILSKMMVPLSLLLIILILVINFNPRVSYSFTKSAERVTSVFELGEQGSLSTQQIKHKIENRMPKVMKAIAENPFFGWGFSDRARSSLDDDVGNFSLVAQVGIFGFTLFLYFWLNYLRMMFKIKGLFSKDSPYRTIFLILIFAFLGFLIAHFTTHQFFGLTLMEVTIYFTCIYIFLSECFIRRALKVNAIKKFRGE